MIIAIGIGVGYVLVFILIRKGKIMADFCRECHEDLFGKKATDAIYSMKLCKEDEMVPLLCEGCGEVVFVDCNGKKI